jgi:hypothetical protein
MVPSGDNTDDFLVEIKGEQPGDVLPETVDALSVPAADQFRTAAPVHDLAAAAGGFGERRQKSLAGWGEIAVRKHHRAAVDVLAL